MTDSWSPRKLVPGLAAQYSMPSDLKTSTMKSAPQRTLEDTSAAAPVASGFCAACWANAMGGLAIKPAAPTAAPVAAPLKNPRRSTFFFDFAIAVPPGKHCDVCHYGTCDVLFCAAPCRSRFGLFPFLFGALLAGL